jgi:hypothetical protein
MDKFAVGLIIFISTFFVIGVYFSGKYEAKAETQAQTMGCEFIGSARDIREVGFFECDGNVVLKRIK